MLFLSQVYIIHYGGECSPRVSHVIFYWKRWTLTMKVGDLVK